MRRTKRSGTERRDQIAKAVYAIVAEEGAGSLSVASVAHRVGLAPSALYRHYPGKEAMIDDALARIGAQVGANFERARASAAAPLDVLGDFLARHVDFILENRGFPLMIFSDAVFQNPSRRARIAATMSRVRDTVAGLLREAQRRGEARPDLDPEAAAFVYFGLFVPPAIQFHLSGGHFDLSGHVRRAWAVYLAGVRAAAPPAARRRAARRVPRQENSP